MAAPSRRLHFGLGPATVVDRVDVRWPDGTQSSFQGLAADARYRIVQGESAPQRQVPRRHPGLDGLVHDPVSVEPRSVERIVLFERLPAAPLVLPAWDGVSRTVAAFREHPLVVLVGAHGDPASDHQLRALAACRAELAGLGAQLVALSSVPEGDAAGQADARARYADLGLLSIAGPADRRFLQAAQVLLVEVLGPFDRLAYPLTLLFDRGGQLAVLYAGTPSVDVLLADVGIVRRLDPVGGSTEPLLGGRWSQPPARSLGNVARVFDLLGDAELARYYHGIASARERR